MKFDINNYEGNQYAIHCRNKQEFDEFLDYLYNNGYDHLAPTFNHRYCYGDNVYYFNNGTWATLQQTKTFVGVHHDIVLEWSDFNNKEFTKADLKTGDVVLRRNGEIEIVNYELGTLICKEGGYNLLSGFKNDLTHIAMREWDIIEVRRPKEKYDCCFDAMGVSRRGILVYERKEPEEMTLEQVCKLLGKEIKIIP